MDSKYKSCKYSPDVVGYGEEAYGIEDYLIESLNEDAPNKAFKKIAKNAYKSADAKNDATKKEYDEIKDLYLPGDDTSKLDKRYADKMISKDDIVKSVDEKMAGLEKGDYPFYVTYYEEYPIYEPAEGGYYYAGCEAVSSTGYETKQGALDAAKEMAEEDGESYSGGNTFYRFGSRYIGEGRYIVVETNDDYLSREKGYEPYN